MIIILIRVTDYCGELGQEKKNKTPNRSVSRGFVNELKKTFIPFKLKFFFLSIKLSYCTCQFLVIHSVLYLL